MSETYTLITPDRQAHEPLNSLLHLPMWVEGACVYLGAQQEGEEPVTTTELCSRVGMSESSLKEYLAGRTVIPYPRLFCLLALALNLDQDQLRELDNYVPFTMEQG